MRERPREQVPPRGVRLSARRREIGVAYLLLAPTVLLMAGALAYPVGWQVWISFTDFSSVKDGSAAFVGLENYRRLLVADPEFWRATAITTVYALATGAAKLALGVAFALLLARPFRGRAAIFVAVFLPWVYPASVSVIGWYWTLNPPLLTSYSLVLGNVKHAVDGVLGSGAWAFVSVALFNIWRGSSFIGILVLAGINAVPSELFECALLESRSGWRRFWLVTVPLLKPFLALAAFLSLTTAFADLANVWLLTGGRITFPVVGTLAYWLAVQAGQFGAASALSLTLVPPLLVALVVLFRMFDPPGEPPA